MRITRSKAVSRGRVELSNHLRDLQADLGRIALSFPQFSGLESSPPESHRACCAGRVGDMGGRFASNTPFCRRGVAGVPVFPGLRPRSLTRHSPVVTVSFCSVLLVRGIVRSGIRVVAGLSLRVASRVVGVASGVRAGIVARVGGGVVGVSVRIIARIAAGVAVRVGGGVIGVGVGIIARIAAGVAVRVGGGVIGGGVGIIARIAAGVTVRVGPGIVVRVNIVFNVGVPRVVLGVVTGVGAGVVVVVRFLDGVLV